MNRIVLSVKGGDAPDPELDPRFGRAEAFLVLDDEGAVIGRAVNPHREAGHGAGPAAAALVRELGATAVISGEFGPKAMSALTALGIATWIAPPGLRASEALARMRAGTLTQKGTREFR